MTPLRPCGRDECRLCHPERRVEPADDSLAQALVGTANPRAHLRPALHRVAGPVSDTKRVTYWCPDKSNPDAVEHAKKAARDEGFTVVTVARVAYVERPTGWSVTLVLR